MSDGGFEGRIEVLEVKERHSRHKECIIRKGSEDEQVGEC